MSNMIPAWPATVTVCEVGLRDGLQNEKTIPSVEQKLQLLNAVVDSGIRIIEVGAFVHPKAVPIESRFLYVDVSALRAKQLRRGARVRLDRTPEELTPAVKLIKPERVAMEEVKQNLVQWDLPDFKVVVDLR